MQLAYDPAIPLQGTCWIEIKNIRLHKELYVNTHSSFIHNGPNLETIQMSVIWWTDKQIVVFPYNWVLLNNE